MSRSAPPAPFPSPRSGPGDPARDSAFAAGSRCRPTREKLARGLAGFALFLTLGACAATAQDPALGPSADDGVGEEAGTIEAGTVETGTVETGTVETGTIEAGTVETGTVEAGKVETGTVEKGADPASTQPAEPAKQVRRLPEPVLPPAEHLAKARQAAEAGDHDSAYDHYERALVGEPDRLHWGAEYRQQIIEGGHYRRSVGFWEALAEAHPDLAHVQLNLGYAYVDKIPVEGAITAVILANKALGRFGQALELEESWLAYYTRGNSYMYWPAIFGRTELGIADLEKALAIAEQSDPRPYEGQAWAALGDGYWRLEQREKMRQVWSEGLERYPGTVQLEERLALDDAELDLYLEKHFETSARVATDLRELRADRDSR